MVATGAFAQGVSDLKLNEVYIVNPADSTEANLLDEYGKPASWIEIANTAYASRDIATFYLTTDRKALDVNLTADERKAMMSRIPSGDMNTKLGPKQYAVFFADGQSNRSAFHTGFTLKAGEENFIALFNGDGIELIDSVTVKPMPAGSSYARVEGAGEAKWQVVEGAKISPKSSNDLAHSGRKETGFKTKDPYGFAMSIIAMGIVFSCLLLLFISFRFLGKFFIKKDNKKAEVATAAPANTTEPVAAKTDTADMDNVMAVIALALHEYQGNMHDVESGILTIMSSRTNWADPQTSLRKIPANPTAPSVK